MSGQPIAQARPAIISALDRLEPGDTFQVIRFSDNASRFGHEPEILREIHATVGESRIFSFGVGSSVNRYLLERMAIAGRGAVA